MKRGGQVTVFVVIGIIVFFVMGILVWKINSMKKEGLIEEAMLDTSKTAPVENYIDMCLESVGTEAVLLLGKQGRIYPKSFLLSAESAVAYFYYEGTGLFPYDIRFIEEDVSRYVKENIHTCLDGFSAFDYEFEAAEDELIVTTTFNQNDASIKMRYPVKIRIGKASRTLSEFNANVNVRFLGLYDAARKIYQKTEGEPEWVDAEFIAGLPYEVKIVKVNGDSLMYEITDGSGLGGRPYTYRFAMKYEAT